MFAVLALRGTGLGFVMITVALGQIVWGIAYRWISLTNGYNGVFDQRTPRAVRASLTEAPDFYWACSAVFRSRTPHRDLRRLAVRRRAARHAH